MLQLIHDHGLKEIDRLRDIYVESNEEVRDYISSRIKEIETEISFGLVVQIQDMNSFS